MGLHGMAERFARLAEEVSGSKKSPHEKRRRLVAGAKALLREAVLDVGFELPLIAVRGNTEATLAIVDLRKKLKGIVSSDPPP